jgi:hypothetical protein
VISDNPPARRRRLPRRKKLGIILGAGLIGLGIVAGVVVANVVESRGARGPAPASIQGTSASTLGSDSLGQSPGLVMEPPPSGWDRFQGDAVSVVLPESFVGGDRRTAPAEIGRVFGPDSVALVLMESAFGDPGFQLFAAGPLADGTPEAMVMATVRPLPNDLPLRQVAYAVAAIAPDGRLTVTSESDSRLTCSLESASVVEGVSMVTLMVIDRSDGQAVVVTYSAVERLLPELERLFETSISRIGIGSPTSTSSTLFDA